MNAQTDANISDQASIRLRVFPKVGLSALILVLGGLLSACADGGDPETPSAAPSWRELFDTESLGSWESTPFGGEAEVSVESGRIQMGQGSPLTGIHLSDCPLPDRDYEVLVVARRALGTDFFCGLTFPVLGAHLTLVVGGWGGSLVGLSCIDGEDASENETCCYQSFKTDIDYTIRLRLKGTQFTASVDDEVLIDLDLEGRRLELRPEVLLSRPFGIASFTTWAEISRIAWRPLS